MKTQEFLEVLSSDGVGVLAERYTEDELSEIHEPRVAAAALCAFWAINFLLNVAEDFDK